MITRGEEKRVARASGDTSLRIVCSSIDCVDEIVCDEKDRIRDCQFVIGSLALDDGTVPIQKDIPLMR
jgi:hypothetical protein